MSTSAKKETKSSVEPLTKAPATEHGRKVAHETVDAAADRAGELEEKVRDQAHRIAEKSGEKTEQARDQLEDGLEKVESFVQKKPLAAAGIAFGAGVLATLLLRRG